MRIDTSHFPLVWLSLEESSDWETELDLLLHRGERFVLITKEQVDKLKKSNKEDKKKVARWLKNNKKQLNQLCAGSIVIVESQTVAVIVSGILAPLRRVSGYPIRVVTEANFNEEVAALFKQGS